MVDPGEAISETLKREFSEEAMGSLDTSDIPVDEIRARVNEEFKSGKEVWFLYIFSVVVCLS